MSVGEHISGTAVPIFTKFVVQILCDRGSVLLWGRCDTGAESYVYECLVPKYIMSSGRWENVLRALCGAISKSHGLSNCAHQQTAPKQCYAHATVRYRWRVIIRLIIIIIIITLLPRQQAATLGGQALSRRKAANQPSCGYMQRLQCCVGTAQPAVFARPYRPPPCLGLGLEPS